MDITNCPYCAGGCRICGYTGMAPIDQDEVRAARETEVSFVEVDLTEHLPKVSLAETKRTIAKLRAEERGIRLVTENGERVPNINRRPRR